MAMSHVSAANKLGASSRRNQTLTILFAHPFFLRKSAYFDLRGRDVTHCHWHREGCYFHVLQQWATRNFNEIPPLGNLMLTEKRTLRAKQSQPSIAMHSVCTFQNMQLNTLRTFCFVSVILHSELRGRAYRGRCKLRTMSGRKPST